VHQFVLNKKKSDPPDIDESEIKNALI